MDEFLEAYNLPRMNQEKNRKPTQTNNNKKIESVTKNLPQQRKFQDQMAT